jgi:hypothetical protein
MRPQNCGRPPPRDAGGDLPNERLPDRLDDNPNAIKGVQQPQDGLPSRRRWRASTGGGRQELLELAKALASRNAVLRRDEWFGADFSDGRRT